MLATMVRMKRDRTRSTPRCIVCAMPPTVLAQPKVRRIRKRSSGSFFLMRRLKNVRTELALNVLAYNIKRMVASVGIKRLMAAIPA